MRRPVAFSRRTFLKASCAGLPALLNDTSSLSANSTLPTRTKSVVLLWMWGGPSQLDTFDPKPDAPAEIRGPFSSIATRTTGLRFSELFPRLANRTHKMTVVRSQINYDNAHRIAGSIALTGGRGRNNEDNDYQPNFGSIVQRNEEHHSKLPAFISIGPGKMQTSIGQLKGYGGGVWGARYDPFPVQCSEMANVKLPALKLPPHLNQRRLAQRRELLAHLQGPRADLPVHHLPAAWEHDVERAWNLLSHQASESPFDLSLESDACKGSYGFTQFGQSCLLARRLVEAKVPYVQVNWSQWVENIYDTRTDFGWDTHWLNFEHMADRHGPIFDRAMSALLDDLDERGLLDDTLVVAMGEFGRTPKISDNGGRDHWHRCQSSLWAGGGVPGGQVIGTSDAHASAPITDPITPEMVGTSILELAGITTQHRAELGVLSEGKPIAGLVK